MSRRCRSTCLAALGGAVLGLAALLAAAQETTSQLTGFVFGADGRPIAGASVAITHVPSGTTEIALTNASGQFTANGLRVGGPYRVAAQAPGMQETAIEELYTQLAQRSSVTLIAQPLETLAGIEVIGSSERDVTIGVGTRFGERDVNEQPSISRDIKDVARIDPKAWVDPTNSDALEVAGVNNRYNTITVDGVRQSDDFGLNNNGYPTQRSPLSVDAIEAVSVLTAPFSVEYSFFHGSTINMVTKSGTNELKGSAYYYKGDDSLLGNQTGDVDVDLVFDEDIYGGTLGGAIVKDRLFYFLAYEKLDRKAPQDTGPTGSGFPVEIPGVTQAEYDRIRSIGLDVYGYDIGETLRTAPEADEKILAKLDWNINGAQRATLAYQRTEGNELIVNTTNNNPATGRVGAPSNWFDRAITMETASLQLFSDWSSRISTELKVARKEVHTAQASLFGTDFGEMIIGTPSGGTVYIGSDEFRQANQLSNDIDTIKLKGSFFLGDHTVTAGYEREMLDINNLFVPRSEGQWTFAGPDGIDAFEAQSASSLSYRNAFTNDARDGAAIFGYDVNSFYVQDEWQATPDLKLEAGVRVDLFSSGDEPALNDNFTDRYGFDNQETLDGRDLFMPRIGFNWQWTPRTTVYGGFGLFGGGAPNVWVSNSFSNDGVTVVQTDVPRPLAPSLIEALDGVNGYDIPQEVLAFNATQRGDSTVNAIDPGFEIPSQYRWNLGVKHTLPFEVELTADWIYSRVKDEVLWRDLRLQQLGTAPDGRPIYGPSDDGREDSVQDLLLANTGQGEGTVLSLELSKTWRVASGRFDVYLGYANDDVSDVNPGTSSTASSNWDNVATSDPNDPGLATSNYEMRHRFNGSLAWRKSFFGDYETSLALFGEHRSGRPYSYTFSNTAVGAVWGDPRQGGNARQRQLFYVPDGDVIFEAPCSQADVDAGVDVTGCASSSGFSSVNAGATAFAADMDAYIRQQGLEKWRGRIVPRNSHQSPWVSLFDLRMAQELPVFRQARGIVTIDVENLANLLNSDWGQLRQVSFPYVAPVVDVDRIETSGCPGGAASCYVYRPRAGTAGPVKPFNTVASLPSVWRIQLGFRIEF